MNWLKITTTKRRIELQSASCMGKIWIALILRYVCMFRHEHPYDTISNNFNWKVIIKKPKFLCRGYIIYKSFLNTVFKEKVS